MSYWTSFLMSFWTKPGLGKATRVLGACQRLEEGSRCRQPGELYPGHAELCFLDWFREKVLFPDEIRCSDVQYRVTWYVSWSPCFECAEQVADFLNENENVDLSIYAARLYLCEDEDEQGLRDLVAAGAKVAMMAPEDFEYCWDNFVYNGGWHFTYWNNVCRNYHTLQQQLNKILWDLRRIHVFIFGTE